MKLRLLAVTCAVLAISALGFTAAGATTTINVRPYVGGTIGLGTTVPGDPASVLCLVLQDGASPVYGGKVNGSVVSGRTGELNVLLKAQDLITSVPTCVPTSIQVATNDPANIDIQGTKPGGTLQISTVTGVQPGISASATTTVRVHYSAGQIIKLPSGAAAVGGALSGSDHVDLKLKATATVTKAVLDTTACSDNQYVIEATVADGSKSNGPTASKIGSTTAGAPSVGDPNTYVATIRDCAEASVVTPGKPITTKISVTGSGAASVDFVEASTDNPQIWDTTRGATCSTVKTAGTFGDNKQSSRVLSCKGDYGAPIPLSLQVRGWVASGSGFKDSFGLIHPAPPTEILAPHTFS